MYKSLPIPTSQQIQIVSSYKEKWVKIATNTNRVDRSKAEEVIHKIYKLLNLDVPVIRFVDSPGSSTLLLKELIEKQNYSPLQSLSKEFQSCLKEQITRQISGNSTISVYPIGVGFPDNELRPQLGHELHYAVMSSAFSISLGSQVVGTTFTTQSWNYSYCYISPQDWACDACYLDWLCNILKCQHDPTLWQIFETLLTECGWIFPFKEVCIIADRPTEIYFDNNKFLHAEGKPAVSFSDGSCVYSYHGVRLPEKYGKTTPQQWQSEWYLEERHIPIRKLILENLKIDLLDKNWLILEQVGELRDILVKRLGIKIKNLTDLQLSELESYHRKWRLIALSVTPIDRKKAASAINNIYAANKSSYNPKILFADSPYLGRKLAKQKCREQNSAFKIDKNYRLNFSCGDPVRSLWNSISAQLSKSVFHQLHQALIINRSWDLDISSFWIQPEELSSWFSLFDFCISVLDCIHDPELWIIMQEVFTECGWFYPAQRTCIICDRPIYLSVDSQDRLHSENEPAIIYTDGYKRRAYHGLPPKQYFKAEKS